MAQIVTRESEDASLRSRPTKKKAAYFFSPLSMLLAAITINSPSLALGAKSYPCDVKPPRFVGRTITDQINNTLENAIKNKSVPGGVLLIARDDQILLEKAFGERSTGVTATSDTIYDLASLTKPLATSLAIFRLIDEKKLQLTDLLSKHLVSEVYANSKITVEDLLRHQSGLPAGTKDQNLFCSDGSPDLSKILKISPTLKPRKYFVYSDFGYAILSYLVEKLSGQDLHTFTQPIYRSIGANDTGFTLSPEQLGRTAPTSESSNIGIPHDPIARSVYPLHTGNAGLFSTARDIYYLARLFLNQGKVSGVRILEEKSVKQMTEVAPPLNLRGAGWDVLSPLSKGPRGQGFSVGGSFGHTGYTGTMVWVDPKTRGIIVLLTNRVLLKDDGASRRAQCVLRNQISTLAYRLVVSNETPILSSSVR